SEYRGRCREPTYPPERAAVPAPARRQTDHCDAGQPGAPGCLVTGEGPGEGQADGQASQVERNRPELVLAAWWNRLQPGVVFGCEGAKCIGPDQFDEAVGLDTEIKETERLLGDRAVAAPGEFQARKKLRGGQQQGEQPRAHQPDQRQS